MTDRDLETLIDQSGGREPRLAAVQDVSCDLKVSHFSALISPVHTCALTTRAAWSLQTDTRPSTRLTLKHQEGS